MAMTEPNCAHRYEEDQIDLLDLLLVLARHKLFIFLTTTLFAVVAIVVALLSTPIYQGTTRLVPPSGGSGAAAMLAQMGVPDFAAGSLGLKTPGDLIVSIVKSRTVADGIIARFNLMERYETEFADNARAAVSANLSAQADPKTGIISLSYQDEDPALAAEITNAFVDELRTVLQGLSITQASQQRLFVEEQLKKAQLDLIRVEDALREYQKATGILDAGAQATALMEAVANLRAEVAAKEVALRSARTFGTTQNPQVQRLQAELAGLRDQLARLEAQSGTEVGLVPLKNLPDAGLEYARLLRDLKFNETLHGLLLRQYEQARMSEANEPTVIQVVDEAVVPDKRIKPKRTLMVVLATVLGGFISLFGAFVLDFLRSAKADPSRSAKVTALKEALSLRRP
jgi:tyrosine-protein kinase Etk/Wzc